MAVPGKRCKSEPSYQKAKRRKKFRRRATVEPVIGYLKSQFRRQDNFLHGVTSPRTNTLLAATAWNMQKMTVAAAMKKL